MVGKFLNGHLGKYSIKVWQVQDIGQYPVYKLPLMLDVWENGSKTSYMIEIDKPFQEFEFDEVMNPELVIVDSDYVLVGEISHTKTAEQYQFQFSYYKENVRARIDALEYFLDSPADSISRIVIRDVVASNASQCGFQTSMFQTSHCDTSHPLTPSRR